MKDMEQEIKKEAYGIIKKELEYFNLENTAARSDSFATYVLIAAFIPILLYPVIGIIMK